MNLQEKTIENIEGYVKRYFYKAFELGINVTPVVVVGANLYEINVGNMKLTYLGTVDGGFKLIKGEGDVC